MRRNGEYMIRKIIEINEDLCNGCGLCANACHENAIAIVEGKAKLIRDDYCDGLGNCLPACPTNAIAFVEREALAYDEEAVKKLQEIKAQLEENMTVNENERPQARPAFTCPGSAAKSIGTPQDCSGANAPKAEAVQSAAPSVELTSELRQWPIQIKLAPVNASYFENANLLIAADCTAYAYANFHKEFMKNKITLIGCPKLDEGDYSEKLTEIIKNNNIKSLKVVRMEVPCCGGIEHAAIQAMKNSGKMIPWQVITISCDGNILDR